MPRRSSCISNSAAGTSGRSSERPQPGDLELFAPLKHDLKKKIASARSATLAAGRPAGRRRGRNPKGVEVHSAERLIVSSDCGFGRQGCNREIAFYKASAIAQGCNIVRGELGLPVTRVPRRIPRCRWT